jgi:hypothetical protein
MRIGRSLWAVLVLTLALGTGAAAQDRAFPATDDALHALLCPARGRCTVVFVTDAGHHGETDLAVVRVASGPRVCVDEPAYRDFLVSSRAGALRRERLLVRGECPCLEWQRSRWAYRAGELRFTYGMMGAPTGYGTDTRETTLHVRPWPLGIVGADLEGEAMAPPAMPARGPILVLTME